MFYNVNLNDNKKIFESMNIEIEIILNEAGIPSGVVNIIFKKFYKFKIENLNFS